MTRTFSHEFDPPEASPVCGHEVCLTVQEIEDAGTREVLQSQGPNFGPWEFLDTLLEPGSPFVFREPLGQAREVKVALSGLLGRFVARAYLQKYFSLSIFLSPKSQDLQELILDGKRRITITRVGKKGDLPDWVACDSSLSNLTVAEAKGSHRSGRPTQVLNSAWAQARRIDILVRGRRKAVNRLAIVTRWGMATGSGPRKPLLWARDPMEEGDAREPDDQDAVYLGVFRHHVANILTGLGYQPLARLLRDLTTEHGLPAQETDIVERASGRVARLLDPAIEDFHRLADGLGIGRASLIGRFIARGAIADSASVSRANVEVLYRLGLRPVVVGFDSELVRLAIEGDPSAIRHALADHQLPTVDRARSDGAGFWIIPLDDVAALP